MTRRINITAAIRQAIMRAVEQIGSQSALARTYGVPQKNLSNYISGVNKTMNLSTWNALYPSLTPFLEGDCVDGTGSPCSEPNKAVVDRIAFRLRQTIMQQMDLDAESKLKFLAIVEDFFAGLK